MANNPYVNKVIYGNQTLIDTTGDTAVASDVASGKTFHSATGEQLTGTKTAPTSITPSNASPVSLSSGGDYTPTANGYAIETYHSIDPQNGPFYARTNSIYRFEAEGNIIKNLTTTTPNNSSPPRLISSYTQGYRVDNDGYAIKNYSVFQEGTLELPAPAGTFVKFEGSGVAIPSVTEIGPSNLTPAPMTSGGFYEAMNSGYAIQSYSSVTPSTSGQYFSSGMVKMSSSGYAYSSRPSSAKVKTGSYTTNYQSAVTITLDFAPTKVIVYCNLDSTPGFVAYSENKGSFGGHTWSNTTAGVNIGTFTWSGNNFSHKTYNSLLSGKTAYYIAVG